MATGGFLISRLDPSAILRWVEARRWKVLAVTLPAILLLHGVMASVLIRHSNLEWWPSDQLAEVYLSSQARNDAVPLRTDGVRHPLWSWTAGHVAGHLYTYDDDKTVFFVRGKWINTLFCLIFLAVLGVAVARWLDPLATVNLLLLCSLGIFIVRGTYFQPEPLYYMFFFLAGLLACRVLRGCAFWHYPVLGVVCGLAFLAKPSLLPFLLVLGAAFLARVFLATRRENGGWPVAKNLAGAGLAAVIFGVMVFPLGRYTTEVYGRPFFSYTKYWMWMDDFKAEAFPFQVGHPGRAELDAIPPAETPSAAWYFRRHTPREAIQRLGEGFSDVVFRFFFPEPKLVGSAFFWRTDPSKWRQPLVHRGVYVIALGVLCAGLVLPLRKLVLDRTLQNGNLVCACFVVMVLGFYTVLYGWYHPVGRGDRFMGSLWIPVVFLLCWLAFSLRRLAGARWSDSAYLGIHVLILAALLLQTANVFWRFGRGWYLDTQN